MAQAGVYSAVLHYLKALKALKSDADGKAVVEQMKKMPTDDPIFGKGKIRQDGRKLHSMYLYEVKKPSESKGEWDLYKLVKEVPADQAFRPIDKGDCPLIASAGGTTATPAAAAAPATPDAGPAPGGTGMVGADTGADAGMAADAGTKPPRKGKKAAGKPDAGTK